jgi:hypothetical protein
MKPITLHPLSVLVGCALVGIPVVLTGAAQQPIVARHIPPDVQVVGQIPAEWWTYIELTTVAVNGTITQQSSFAVPADRFLVVTSSYGNWVLENGSSIGEALVPTVIGDQDSSDGTRFKFQPGVTLTTPPSLSSGQNTTIARLWGYLEPVR